MIRVTLRLPDELHEQIAALAAQEDRSLNQAVVRAIRREIERAGRVLLDVLIAREEGK